MGLNGLMSISVELTSRCNKGDGTPGSGCFMCGRRKLEKDHPELCDWGDMSFHLVDKIAQQVPEGVTVQLHNNGEPTLYPELGRAIKAFSHCLTGFDTNGKLLMERHEEILTSGLNSLTISIIPNDPEAHDQLVIVDEFLYERARRGGVPLVVFRLLGDIDPWRCNEIQALMAYEGTMVVRRALHAPEMSREYNAPVVIPEMGICLEALHKLSVDRYGNIFPCVRFNPNGHCNFGSLNYGISLDDAWNGVARKSFLYDHRHGARENIKLCAECQYYGCVIPPR